MSTNWEQLVDPNSGRPYFVDHNSKKSTFVSPFGLPNGFEMQIDNENKPYFVNHSNQTSSYVDPRGAVVQMMPVQQSKDIYAEAADGLCAGLHDALASRSHFYLKQKFGNAEILEAVTGCQMSNKYELYDPEGRVKLLEAAEESDCCLRQVCGGMAPFEMGFKVPGQEGDVFRLKREFACTDTNQCIPYCSICNMLGCAQTMQVFDHNGNQIGAIEEKYGTWCCNGVFGVKDRDLNEKFELNAGCLQRCGGICCQDVVMDLSRLRSGVPEHYGHINRKFICKCGHMLADMDNFEIKVEDENANVEEKTLTIALAVLMKYIYFEESGDN